MPAVKIEVNIPGEMAYAVRVGEGVLEDIGRSLKDVPDASDASSILVLTDDNVGPLYLKTALRSLQQAGYKTFDITIPSGEGAKSIAVAEEVWEAMAQLGMNRDCALVALGGGVVGDVGGFIASTFMRGIPVVQAPTTLLAMVDSSVGGKTAVNLRAGKNLVGTFFQPSFVCASLETLATLPEREWLCGLGEVAKSAAIDSDDFFFWMMSHAKDLSERNMDAASDAICRCIVFKAGVVAQDKQETKGVRECLNYGHTLAHAIEKIAGYGLYSHGAAVAEGMRFAAFLGVRNFGTSEEFATAQSELLDSLGLARLDWRAEPAEILEAMKRDKKTRASKLRFVILKDVADWSVEEVDDDVVLDALADFMEQQ